MKHHPSNSNIDPFQEYCDVLSDSVEKAGFGRLTNNVALFADGSKAFLENSNIQEILSVLK